MSTPKKFYTYQKVECTKLEYIKQRQEWVELIYKELEKETKRHNSKMDKLNARVRKLQDEIIEAQREK